MIFEALGLLKDELDFFIRERDDPGGTVKFVVLGNIAFLEDSQKSSKFEERVVISLVNVEEESALKNSTFYRKLNGAKEVSVINPPVFLNLYLLFSSNFPDYDNSLRRLSYVIEFFQGKNTFSLKNSPAYEQGNILNADQNGRGADFRLILDLYTLTFEQINHLWGSLGGKQIPFAMYKCRMIKISESGVQRQEPVIEEVNGQEQTV